jgi:hypothetical protein
MRNNNLVSGNRDGTRAGFVPGTMRRWLVPNRRRPMNPRWLFYKWRTAYTSHGSDYSENFVTGRIFLHRTYVSTWSLFEKKGRKQRIEKNQVNRRKSAQHAKVGIANLQVAMCSVTRIPRHFFCTLSLARGQDYGTEWLSTNVPSKFQKRPSSTLYHSSFFFSGSFRSQSYRQNL